MRKLLPLISLLLALLMLLSTTSQVYAANEPPTVTTKVANNFTWKSVTGYGYIDSHGSWTVTQCGFEWGLISGGPYPNSKTKTCELYAGSTFSDTLTGLSPETIYYYRAKAYNIRGWGYGGEESFTTTKENQWKNTWQVSSSSNDVRVDWNGSSWDFALTNPIFIVGWGCNVDATAGGGMRFQGVSIPQGYVIEEALLSVMASSTDSATVKSKISGEDSDNAVAFSTSTDYFDRERTTEFVYWDNPQAFTSGNWYSSPDITAIIQEIINRDSWSGDSLVIFWDDHDDRTVHTTGNQRVVFQWDGYPSGGQGAKLTVTWSEPAPTATGFIGAVLGFIVLIVLFLFAGGRHVFDR